LEGMHETIQRDRPDIICEVLAGGGAASRLEHIMLKYGYNFYHLSASGPQHTLKVLGHPDCLNYLFTFKSPQDIESLTARANLAKRGGADGGFERTDVRES
jgi:hypothetical protein